MIYKTQNNITINSNFFDTDFYQLAMSYVFIMDNKANEITGYEGFIRNVKSNVNVVQDFLIFSGADKVKEYINNIQDEIRSPYFKEMFISILEDKIPTENWQDEFSKKFDALNMDFEYTVAKENSLVIPYIPVFQFRGPKWIGQIIETYVTNIYNARTGLATIKYLKKIGVSYITEREINYLDSIVNDIGGTYYEQYISDIKYRAEEFKEVDVDGILLEAAFRRAPSHGIANLASEIALKAGWTGTSNVSILNQFNKNKIGGTMAHAFVMSYETEIEAFKVWNKYFPNSTILVDTYDTITAVKSLIENNIKPKEVRIDSGQFTKIVPKVRKILDEAGWTEVGIFISGDITPEIITKLRNKNIPFTKSMAGTHYVYCNELVKKINCGFVYKIVEYTDDKGVIQYPEKKSIGKKNYPGLKSVKIIDNKVIVSKNIEEKLNLDNNIEIDKEIVFNI